MSRLFSLIYQGTIQTSSRKKIIPLEDFSTLMTAVEVLDKAREDAEELHKTTVEECTEIKETAKKAGFAEGLQQLNGHVIALDQEKKRLRHEMNKLILPLALKVARKIVAQELSTRPETIVDIVLQALAPVLQSHRITIWVNKVDKEILETAKPQIREKLDQVESFLIKERDDISPGGCTIETEHGMINATIENQWHAIEAAFERYGITS